MQEITLLNYFYGLIHILSFQAINKTMPKQPSRMENQRSKAMAEKQNL